MAIGQKGIDLALNVRALIDHSQCTDMATRYHLGQFNHGNSCRLLHEFLKEQATEEEILKIYPRGL